MIGGISVELDAANMTDVKQVCALTSKHPEKSASILRMLQKSSFCGQKQKRLENGCSVGAVCSIYGPTSTTDLEIVLIHTEETSFLKHN